MRKIYKYPIPAATFFRLELPKDAKVIHVDVQEKSGPCMWVLFDCPEIEFEIREFAVVATGEPFWGDEWTHLGTFLITDKNLVFHLFDTGVRFAKEHE